MIWLDLDNTPHVPLFRPILRELSRDGQKVFVTSREHAQTGDLLKLWNIPHTMVGAYGGKGKIGKVLNLVSRSQQLTRLCRTLPITLAVSHGSRTQMLAARWLGVPSLVMDDYEYSEQRLAGMLASRLLFPACIPDARLEGAGLNLAKVLRYQGYKEEVYLRDFVPVPGFRETIGVDESAILVTLRPPSLSANYHDARSEALFVEAVKRFGCQPGTFCLVVNRGDAERRLIPREFLASGRARFLEKPVDGLQLLWQSDAVLSGGGTMNREAALMGVPTYSVFTGRRPAVDEQLEREGRLVYIESPEQARALPVAKRTIGTEFTPTNTGLAAWIARLIRELAEGSAVRD